MNKPLRNAVRCFLIKDDKVICIKHLMGRVGYYDIPGGKIEENETALEAVKREFIEETGVEVINPVERGTMYVSYPDKDFTFKVFISSEYTGKFEKSDENTVELRDIENLLLEKKRFINTILLESSFKKILLDSGKRFEISTVVDKEDNLIELNFKIQEQKA